MNDTEVRIIFELLRFLEFWVVAQFLNNFLHKGFVCGFREPALLIQQSQDSWRTSLRKVEKRPRNEGGFETTKHSTKFEEERINLLSSQWVQCRAAGRGRSQWSSTRCLHAGTPPAPGRTWCGWTAAEASRWCSWCRAAQKSSATERERIWKSKLEWRHSNKISEEIKNSHNPFTPQRSQIQQYPGFRWKKLPGAWSCLKLCWCA